MKINNKNIWLIKCENNLELYSPINKIKKINNRKKKIKFNYIKYYKENNEYIKFKKFNDKDLNLDKIIIDKNIKSEEDYISDNEIIREGIEYVKKNLNIGIQYIKQNNLDSIIIFKKFHNNK